MHIKKSNSKGFTLIELLIVIIIIGILAAIAFVAYTGSQNRAKKADAQATLSQVKSKLGEYNADHSSYPAAGTPSTGNVDNWIKSSAGGNNTGLGNKFTDANNYTYSVVPSGCGDTVASDGTVTTGTTACTGFTLTAQSEIFGGGDDITTSN